MNVSVLQRGVLGALVLVLACAATAPAAKRATKAKVAKPVEANVVELFDAMKSGEIEVRVIAKDSTTGNILIKNKTKKPLSIKLPEAFVGIPANAQFGGGMGGGMGGMGGGMGGMGGGMGGMGGGMGGMNQAMGGGMGGMGGGMGGMGGGMGGMGGGGMGGMGGGGGFFKIAPEKVGKIKMNTMCLEHGKKDPSPHVEYKLIPVETFISDAKVVELVKMLARGEIDQRSAQAAAWNLANGMSWRELATKIGAKHLDGSTELYFSGNEIRRGMAFVEEAERRALENAKKTPGKENSLSVN